MPSEAEERVNQVLNIRARKSNSGLLGSEPTPCLPAMVTTGLRGWWESYGMGRGRRPSLGWVNKSLHIIYRLIKVLNMISFINYRLSNNCIYVITLNDIKIRSEASNFI